MRNALGVYERLCLKNKSPIQILFDNPEDEEKARVDFLAQLLSALDQIVIQPGGLKRVHLAAVDWEPGPVTQLAQGKWHMAPNLVRGFGRHTKKYVSGLAIYAWMPANIKVTDFIFNVLPEPVCIFVRVWDETKFFCQSNLMPCLSIAL